jgi:hypothetical protein
VSDLYFLFAGPAARRRRLLRMWPERLGFRGSASALASQTTGIVNAIRLLNEMDGVFAPAAASWSRDFIFPSGAIDGISRGWRNDAIRAGPPSQPPQQDRVEAKEPQDRRLCLPSSTRHLPPARRKRRPAAK